MLMYVSLQAKLQVRSSFISSLLCTNMKDGMPLVKRPKLEERHAPDIHKGVEDLQTHESLFCQVTCQHLVKSISCAH